MSTFRHLAAQQDAAKQAGNRLEKGGRPLVAPATVFLSHCWHDGLSADDVLSAAIAVMQEGDYAWIDIYALSDGADSGGGGHVRCQRRDGGATARRRRLRGAPALRSRNATQCAAVADVHARILGQGSRKSADLDRGRTDGSGRPRCDETSSSGRHR